MKPDTIFIAWNQISRRSEEFSRKIGAEYINLGRVDKPLIMRLLNLLKNFFKTYVILQKRKPHIIFTFHAHPFITLVAIIYKLTNRCKVVPDLHSAAYLDYYRFPLIILTRWIWNQSDLLIIHNQMSAKYFDRNIIGFSEKIFVLEDPIPDLPKNIKRNKKLAPEITRGVLISRFSPDEPIVEFIEKIKGINDFQLYITGDYSKENIIPSDYDSEKIIFTGFIEDEEYWRLLNSARLIIALTTREYTLLSAGYEALSLEKPLLLSDSKTLRDYYGNFIEYLPDDSLNISQSIQKVIDGCDHYHKLMIKLKLQKSHQWDEKLKHLMDRVLI
mgnify:CR=1 FL=1